MRKIRRKSTKKKKTLLTVVVAIVVLCILGLAGAYVAAETGSDKILRNVFVDGIRIGGLSPSEAEKLLEKEFAGRSITVVLDDNNKRTFSPEEFGLMYKTNVIVGKAYEIGKSSNFGKNVVDICTSFFKPARLSSSQALVTVDRGAELMEYLDEYALQPTESKFEITDDSVVVTNGMNGREVDVDKLYSMIVNAKSYDEIKTIQAPINVLPFTLLNVDDIYRSAASDPRPPYSRNNDGKITATVKVFNLDLAREIQKDNAFEGESYEFAIDTESVAVLDDEALYPDVIGEMTTEFDTGYSTRAHNIKLAAGNLNGVELLPGEEFSFNGNNGDITLEKGYQVATGYYNGEVAESVGGGVCQVSSTLYDAVLFADLKIVKRTNHSLPVAYLPLGQDAAISYPSLDFKFKNTSEGPIKITAQVNGGKLTIQIHGQKSDSFTEIKIVNNTLSVLEPKTREVVDNGLKPGERITSKSGSRGYVVESYRVVYKDGVEIRRDALGKSTYKAQDRVVRVGPEPEKTAETEENNE